MNPITPPLTPNIILAYGGPTNLLCRTDLESDVWNGTAKHFDKVLIPDHCIYQW